MSAVPSHQPSRRPENRPVTLAMRVALGLLHTGPLIRDADGHWRCRAYPGQRVLDVTVRGLLERCLAEASRCTGLYGEERECVELAEAGRSSYRGGPLSGRRPPPVSPEVVLRQIEEALALLDRESKDLAAATLRESEAARSCARALAEIEARLAKLARTREALDARRTDLRAIVAHAAERLMESLQEAGR